MRESSRYIILSGAFAGLIGCLYFLSLLVALPVYVTAVLLVVCLYFMYKWVWIVPGKSYSTMSVNENGKMAWIAIAVLAIGLCIIGNDAATRALKYGNYDAWSIWNLHAEYLANPDLWKKLFLVPGHTDYPLCQPAIIAFFFRLLPLTNMIVVPFVFSVFTLFSIPALIFQEVSRKNVLVAAAVLAIFMCDRIYITAAVSQYADTLLAFFFLCAFVCTDHVVHDRKYIAVAAFFLGCCAWTKNEGAVLAIIFLAYYGKTFFTKKDIKYTIAGLMLPLLSLLILKVFFPVQNDLVSESSTSAFGYLVQGGRYAAIFNSYVALCTKFMWTSVAICLYVALCIVKKVRPGRQMLILCSCLFIYSMIYVVTPKDLGWHLKTSQDRLMLQLMPALIYVMATQAAGMNILQFVPGKKGHNVPDSSGPRP